MAANKSVFRRFFKILLIVVAVHAVVIATLHIWFVNNARGILKQIIYEKSGGKLKLELSKLSFDFFSNKLQVREADLESTDSITQDATYHVKFRKLTLRVHSFWPLILQKKLQLDSIKLHDPVINVLLWRKDTTSKFARSDVSLPQEMGKLYNSMLDVLEGFGIRRIIINNAQLSLINKIVPGSKPVSISNIYLDVMRSGNSKYKRDDFVANEQSVDLRTANQNISLPGGRHQLSFKTFTLQLFRKHIELDSCTITAVPTAQAKSSYKIFFSKLLLIGVDFNAMYESNLIKADSVYCENPLFDINLYATSSSEKKKERPDPEKIIRELTGDLDLAFVGVKDAGIHININGNKTRSLFNSNKDNFEMRGLRVNSDSSVPVMVQQFDMLVRDYRLYNEDSTTAYSFDSVKFKNNKIVLNNFTVVTNSGANAKRSIRDYRIPYFELTGLDWYQLVFDENLKAREAVLYNPVINYTRNQAPVLRRKTKLFTSLQNIDDLVTLDKVNIIQGQINMKFGTSSSFNFRDVNLSLYSNKLLKSTNREGLRKAVDFFSFSKGIIRIKDVTAELNDVRYTGSNLIRAGNLSIHSKSDRITASVNDVYIDNMLLNEDSEIIEMDGLRWKSATVSMKPSPGGAGGNDQATTIFIKNVSGNNTQFNYEKENTTASSFIQTFLVSSLSKERDKNVEITGLFLKGRDLAIQSERMQVNAGSFQLASELPSFLGNLEFRRINQLDSMSIKSPRVSFTPDISGFLAKDFYIKDVQVQSLDVKSNNWNAEPIPIVQKAPPPSLRIDRIIALEPDIHITSHRNDSVTVVNIPRSDNSVIKASNLTMNNEGLKLNRLSLNTNSATFVKRTGEVIGVEDGTVSVELSNMRLSNQNGMPSWAGTIDQLYLQNPNSFVVGRSRQKIMFDELSAGNLQLSSEYMNNFDQLMRLNVSAWLRSATGHFIDSITTIKWYKAGFNNQTRTLSLDSFVYHPTQPRDSVILKTPHQTDYITFTSGPVEFTGFNLEQYKQDSSLIAEAVNITNPVVTIYRDKLPPFLAGIIKPLPVNSIKKISLPISVSQINIREGRLTYTERKANTRAEGTVLLTHINGEITNIKNRNLDQNDSLSLSLNAYLMDSALIHLGIRESYQDTLSGFLMTLKMKPTSMSFLNPVLAPLSNVIIRSGTIDSLYLRAIGRENIALGEMNMYYHNLRIKIVKPGEPDKTDFKGKVVSWVANTFVIRKNNKGKTGLVYFERLRDRSFFNYIVKMTFSGMATSLGVKKNRRYKKLYERELRDQNLPPILQ